MNFIFVSPQFPKTYWNFCDRLKQRGVCVLGIGDTPYDELDDHVKASLVEYYRVDNMENYEEMFRAVAYFSFRYGKIDWIESNNEYWLAQDARLRSDFHITTGYQSEEVWEIRSKSRMKKYYAQAGIPTARWHMEMCIRDSCSACCWPWDWGERSLRSPGSISALPLCLRRCCC